ncbi:hypothetical protein JIN85_11030 [Luteolibacter pohnpeiensis]|uniref:Uncharacterized protein n=1 Tax=Luteolibacter pohnpeiensis TaxID=454153 RepID=A0A934VUW1_9BACT|nr:hypothetical protein [Luteolibacter pohnpeiensis]
MSRKSLIYEEERFFRRAIPTRIPFPAAGRDKLRIFTSCQLPITLAGQSPKATG